MKCLITGLFTAAILAASPVWADGGHGRGGDDHGRHGGKHFKHDHRDHDRDFRQFKHGRRGDREVVIVREYQPRIVERHVTYIEPAPVYVQQPGFNIFIPLR
jgi:hypothetical protein